MAKKTTEKETTEKEIKEMTPAEDQLATPEDPAAPGNQEGAEKKPGPWDMVEMTTDMPAPGEEDEADCVGINGRMFRLPRGTTFNAPRCVKAEYERSKKAKRDSWIRATKRAQDAADYNAAQQAKISSI